MSDNALTRISRDSLTPQLKLLVDEIGITQTYRFLVAFGGQRLDLPRVINKYDHPVAMVIGVDDANRLCRMWHDTHYNHECIKFQVPAFSTVLLEIRKVTICELAETKTYNEIAAQLQMTYRYVSRFIANHCDGCRDRRGNSGSKITKIDEQDDLFINDDRPLKTKTRAKKPQ